MMKLTILSPGKTREPWLESGIREYLKRLGRYCEASLITVDDSPDSLPAAKALEEEGNRILARIGRRTFVVALDLSGAETDSPGLTCLMENWMRSGGGDVVFVIGGANGLSRRVLARAQAKLCLSKMTFTHQMARLVLLEQCYRAFRILSGEPYHK